MINCEHSIAQKCFWIFINLLSSSLCIEIFIKQEDYVAKLMDFVFRETDFSHEALRIFVVITRKENFSFVEKLRNQGIMELFIFVIKHLNETKLLKLALEGLYNIFSLEKEQAENNKNKNFVLKFESLNGENVLIELQHHKNIDVYNLVFMIFDEFFQIDEDY